MVCRRRQRGFGLGPWARFLESSALTALCQADELEGIPGMPFKAPLLQHRRQEKLK